MVFELVQNRLAPVATAGGVLKRDYKHGSEPFLLILKDIRACFSDRLPADRRQPLIPLFGEQVEPNP